MIGQRDAENSRSLKILMVAVRFPFPPNSGDKLVCFNRLRSLSRCHKLTLVCLADRLPSSQDQAIIEKYCELHFVVKSRWRSILDVGFWGLLAGDALQLAYFRSTRLRRLVEKLHTSRRFDIAHIFLLRASPFVASLDLPCVFDVNDAQSLAVLHRRKHANVFLRAVLAMEAARVKALEQRLGGQKQRVVVLSERDRSCFRGGIAIVVPMGVDFPKLERVLKSNRPLVVFSGNMSYYANEVAALWFVKNCWPTIVSEIPSARLRIIGMDPSHRVLICNGRDGVEVTGKVADVSEELAAGWVAIAPMTVSWGMHFKVMEAMAAKVPVVASRAAGTIYGASQDEGVFLCSNPDEFTYFVKQLLLNPEQAHRLGEDARSFASERFSWEAAACSIESIYKDLVISTG